MELDTHPCGASESLDARSEPSAVIWRWRPEDQETEGPRSFWSCPASQAMVMAGVACFLAWRGHPLGSRILAGLACTVLVVGFGFPQAFERFNRLTAKGIERAGKGVAIAALVPVYGLVFIPFAWIFRLLGKDPMTRQFPAPESSCWIPRPAKESSEQTYTRQY